MIDKQRLPGLVLSLTALLAGIGTAAAQGRAAGQGSGNQPPPMQQEAQAGSRQPTSGQARQQGPGGQAQSEPRSGGQADRRQSEEQKEIRSRLRDRDIYGRELMTAEERERYRERVNAATTDREWARIREEHMNEMRRRAETRGRDLDAPVYGQHMLTERERSEYTKRLQAAGTDAERRRVQEEHREMIQERARLLGLEVPRD